MQGACFINFAKIDQIVFEISCLHDDYTQTRMGDTRIDATEYIISRPLYDWQLIKPDRCPLTQLHKAMSL